MGPKALASRSRRPRRRLGVEQRRAELIALGMELFSTRPYEEIWIEEVAQQAGISRGLLYHYFPTKRDFYVAVSRAAADEVRELTEPDPALPATEQARAALDSYLRNAKKRPHGFLTAYRGSLAGDPEVRAIVEDARQQQAERIVKAFGGTLGRRSAVLRLAAQGWVALVQDVTARWLHERGPALADVREMLLGALQGAVSVAVGEDRPLASK